MLNHAMYAVLKLSINILKKQVRKCLNTYWLYKEITIYQFVYQIHEHLKSNRKNVSH